jgi:hypothetical protein
LASKLEPLLRTGVARIRKPEFTNGFMKAHELAFKESNILGGFRGTGIHPYYPPKVLRQITEILPSGAFTTSISPSPGNPFNEAVMTSSPSDIGAVRAANAFPTHQIESGDALTSPVRKYIPYLVRASEHTWTKKIILEQQNTEMREVIEPRKRVLSGKRKVINGDSLITTVKHLRGIKAAEKATQKRDPKRRKAVGGQAVKAQSVSSDEFECPSDSGSEDVAEIGDCIVVRR